MDPPRARKPARLLVLLCGLGLLGALALVPLAYWLYANSVPALSPDPATPVSAGRRRGEAALWRLALVVGTETVPAPERATRRTERLLGRVRPHLEDIRAALKQPWGPAPIEVPAEDVVLGGAMPGGGGVAPHPLSEPIRTAAQLFVLEAEIARRRGDTARALDLCLDAVELGSCVARGGSRERYAGQACVASALEEAERLLPVLRGEELAAPLARLRRLRAGWQPMPEMIEVDRRRVLQEVRSQLVQFAAAPPWEQHRALGWSVFLTPGPGSRLLGAPPSPSIPGWADWPSWQRVLTPKGRILAEVNGYYDRLSREYGRPVAARQVVPEPNWSPIWGGSEFSFTGKYKGEWPKSDLLIWEAALAVRLHFLAHGRYPATLAEVDRQSLPEPPKDLWDNPIGYRLRNGLPVVYAPGPDRKDDGGRAMNPQDAIGGKPGDLVFGRLCQADWTPPRPRKGAQR